MNGPPLFGEVWELRGVSPSAFLVVMRYDGAHVWFQDDRGSNRSVPEGALVRLGYRRVPGCHDLRLLAPRGHEA